MNGNRASRCKMMGRSLSAAACGLLSLLIGVILSGCASEQGGDQTAETGPEQVCLGDVNMADAMQAAQDVLIAMQFNIEKADPKTGLIRTQPLSGAQFFEPWRKDSVGSFNKTEANLHSIRRTVELQINEKDGACITCRVSTQRLNLPEMEVSSSSRAYAMFSESSASLQRIRLNPEQQAGIAWIDLGNDARLAENILERIERQVSDVGGKEQI
ncbi:MAG TPA: hypothetical protein VJJ98_04155 [Sedimentisphaerales bacterium]|nr:hypothetical protein [Sedimentisphaerales bacterium]